MSRLAAVFAAAALCGTVGCGGAQQSEVEAGFADMKREMRGLRDAYEAQSRRLEAVQDRLALVEDQLESRALHGAPVPQRLPVVRLTPSDRLAGTVRPAPPPAPASVPPPLPDPPMPAPPSEVAAGTITQADIEALDGAAPRRRSGRRRAVPPPANAAHAGNIGVARLAPQPDFDDGGAPAAAAVAPIPTAAPPAVVPDEPIAAFKAAERMYRAGDLVAAIGGFEAFVQRWPEHGYADNALFLSGRCRYARAEYAPALAIFRRVLSTYPAGNQVPDALLMIGLTQRRMGREAEGRETLTRLRAMYPDSSAARQAGAELDRSQGRM